jgi:ABC-type Fe3+-hydroxamate transport system substrate-binding protein
MAKQQYALGQADERARIVAEYRGQIAALEERVKSLEDTRKIQDDITRANGLGRGV